MTSKPEIETKRQNKKETIFTDDESLLRSLSSKNLDSDKKVCLMLTSYPDYQKYIINVNVATFFLNLMF